MQDYKKSIGWCSSAVKAQKDSVSIVGLQAPYSPWSVRIYGLLDWLVLTHVVFGLIDYYWFLLSYLTTEQL